MPSEDTGIHSFRLRKADLVLFGAVLLGACALFLFLRLAGTQGVTCVVFVDGEERERVPLTAEQTLSLSGFDGGENILVIENGKAYVADADCPDGLCVRQGAIFRDGESIICLPHRIVITVEGGEDAPVDAIAR
ncbi:MAG: NusG domain II-containing protein [Lachnospiraceae bacterium]|nr:NusG domain II-containing protein [Lachnospiraceae bacterium]